MPDRRLQVRRFAAARHEHWYLPVLIGALVALLAVWTLTERQNRSERHQAIGSAVRANQSRVRSFEQYVLRTVAAADLIAQHAAHLAEESPAGDCPQISSGAHEAGSSIATSVLLLLKDRTCLLWGESVVDDSTTLELRTIGRKNQKDLIVAPPVATSRPGYVVPVIRVISRDRGDIAIVLVDPERFTDFARDIPFSATDTVSLIGLDAVIRARRVGDQFSTGQKVEGLVMERQAAEPNGTYLGPSVLDGLERYFSHRRLPEIDLFVTSGVPVADIARGSLTRTRVNYAIAAMASFGILIAATLLILSTQRRQRQIVELSEANSRLNEAQRIGSIGDWDYFPEQDLLVWSDNLRRMMSRGHHENESGLAEIQRYTSSANLLRINEQMAKVQATGAEVTWDVTVAIDGETRLFRVIAVPIRGQSGDIIGVHGTTQDITSEAELRSLHARVAELARLDSMSAITATLAHELNQPLGVASNYLAAAARISPSPGAPDRRIAEYLAAARNQLDHLSQIILAARSLVSRSRAPIASFKIGPLLDEVVLLLQTSPQVEQASFQIQVERDAATVHANAAQLKQVVFNLAKNGVEAVPLTRQASIQIRVSRGEQGATTIEVSDNGGGLDGLDDPFAALSTTKPHGLGLGLSLARTIVEAHGGKIWIADTSENGTVVAFTLPPPLR